MKRVREYTIPIYIIAVIALSIFISCRKSDTVDQYNSVRRPANIKPDYSDTVIPPNIAPLNFTIGESGKKFLVKIYAPNGKPITVHSNNAKIKIPLKPWKRLLRENKGNKLFFDIFVYGQQKGWQKYQTISNIIANEEVDSYLVYRFMQPIHNWWVHIGIYQRNVTNYKRSLVLHGDSLNHGCINCHTFYNNTPEKMTIGIRSRKYGSATLMSSGKKVAKIGTKWGYTSWHPSGELAAYSMNKVRQFFHTNELENRDVVDLDSAIVYYILNSQEAKTVPALSRKDQLETYPTWSPDGKYLYYCNAPIPWRDRNKMPPEKYNEVQYDLMRISYDLREDKWGEPETILSAKETGLSILLPRVTPDGRYLVFSMCDYGCFPIYRTSSDLYLMDLETRRYKKMEVNSEYSESWHSFSANSRWMAFSSKKRGGLFTRTYFAYIDENGFAHKPFILPQKDPTYYDSLLHTYSVPELIMQPVPASAKAFGQAARSEKSIEVSMPITGATPTAQDPYQWQQERE